MSFLLGVISPPRRKLCPTDEAKETSPLLEKPGAVSKPDFVQSVLGYTWNTSHGCYTGEAVPAEGGAPITFYQKRNDKIYHVEHPDGIAPANENGTVLLQYSGNNVPAAVRYSGRNYKVASFGFPLETIVNYMDMAKLIWDALDYFAN